jgi:DNA-binding winged helix-turn-helix (wHTH) protein
VSVNSSKGFVRFAGFELDVRAGELHKDGSKTVRLPEQPFQILTMLLEHRGEVVTREEIRKRLWPNDTIVEFEHSISAAMNRLRQTLGDSADNPRYIETLARRGYRLLVPVEWLKAPSDSESSAASSPEDSSAPDSTLDGRPSLGRADLSVNSAELRADLECLRNATQAQSGLIRRRWQVRLGAIAAMLVVGAAVAWFVRRQTGTQPELQQLQLTSNSGEDPVTSGAISPDGKYLAYADLTGMHIKLIGTGEGQTIPQPENLKGGPERWRVGPWFRDGTRFLANASQPEKHELVPWLSYPKLDRPSVWMVSIIGGAPRKLRDGAFAWAVSPDDASVAFTANSGKIGDREVWLMDSDGARPRKLFETDENSDFRNIQWSPDGLRVG